MLSLQRSSNLPGHLTPWFARPVPASRGHIHQRSLSNSTSEGEDERSFYDEFPMQERTSFRHRYPPTYKKRVLKAAAADVVQQQQQSSCLGDDDISLPADPRTWMREDVQRWIRYMSEVHNLPSVQSDRFLMNGKALCLMTMDMFCQRVPLGGKMLFKDFQLRLSMAMYNSGSSWQ